MDRKPRQLGQFLLVVQRLVSAASSSLSKQQSASTAVLPSTHRHHCHRSDSCSSHRHSRSNAETATAATSSIATSHSSTFIPLRTAVLLQPFSTHQLPHRHLLHHAYGHHTFPFEQQQWQQHHSLTIFPILAVFQVSSSSDGRDGSTSNSNSNSCCGVQVTSTTATRPPAQRRTTDARETCVASSMP